MNEEDIKRMNLSKLELIGWIRLWWHSLWRMLSKQDHRMSSFKIMETTSRFPSVKPNTRVAVFCACEEIFWLHPDIIKDFKTEGITNEPQTTTQRP